MRQRGIVFSPNSKWFASGSWDGSLRVWDIVQKSLHLILDGHIIHAYALAWKDNYLITGTINSLKCWRIDETSSGLNTYLQWTTQPYLYSGGCRFDNAINLSPLNQKLLEQRFLGGIGNKYVVSAMMVNKCKNLGKLSELEQKLEQALQYELKIEKDTARLKTINDLNNLINQLLLKITPNDSIKFHNLGCYYHAIGLALKSNPSALELAEYYFQKSLSLKEGISIYTEYAIFLLEQQRLKEALFYLGQAIFYKNEIADEPSGKLIYDIHEYARLPPSLQKIIERFDTLELEAITLAYYLSILVYTQLNDLNHAIALLPTLQKKIIKMKNQEIRNALLDDSYKATNYYPVTTQFGKVNSLFKEELNGNILIQADSMIPSISYPKQNQNIENSAVKFFLGNNPAKESLLQFKAWYYSDVFNYFLGMLQNQSKCIPVVFHDATDDNNAKTFKNQLQQLIMLSGMLKRPALFISKEPGADNHFIVGLVKNNHLLLINPLGITTHQDCYQILAELKKERIVENLWLSSTPLQQKDYEPGLVSCGPITLELAMHILTQFTPEKIENFWSQLKATNESTCYDATGLVYYGINIANLLPDELKDLIKANIDEYKQKIMDIRQRHCSQLNILPESNAQLLSLSVETYLTKCRDEAPAQVVFNALNTSHTINTINEFKEYKLLKKELLVNGLKIYEDDTPQLIEQKSSDKNSHFVPKASKAITASEIFVEKLHVYLTEENFVFSLRRMNEKTIQIRFTAEDSVLMNAEGIKKSLIELSKLLQTDLEKLGLKSSCALKPSWKEYSLSITSNNQENLEQVVALLKSAGVQCCGHQPNTWNGLFFKPALEKPASAKETPGLEEVTCAMQ